MPLALIEHGDCVATNMENFLSKILPDCGHYYIAAPSENGPGFAHFPFTTISAAVVKALEINGSGRNTYFSCASFKEASYIGATGKTQWRTGLNAGWAKSFWCEIDCGADKAAKGAGYEKPEQAVAALKAFCLANGLPIPLIVKSGGGLHCYWVFTQTVTKDVWLPVAFKFKTLAKDGKAQLFADPARTADIASVLRPVGTTNWKPERAGAEVTMAYDMEPMEFAAFQAAVEAAHAQMLADRPAAKQSAIQPFTGPSLSLGDLSEMLGHIDPDVERAEWWAVLVAVADQYGETARDHLRDWSAGVLHNREAERYDEGDFEYQYSDALNRADFGGQRVTMGSVVMMARNGGWVDPRGPIPTATTWVAELNQKYAWIEENASIFRIEYADFIEPQKFKTQLDNQMVTVTSGGTTKTTPMGTAWLKNPDRRQHRKLVLRPKDTKVTADGCLNEWQGFAVAPCAGNIKPFLWLQRRLIPNRTARRYVLMWLAHLVQHPNKKMHVALAFWSLQQGVGKNLLFECITSIIGSAHSGVIGQAELASSFNGWANRKVFAIGDEVSGTDRRPDTDKLKGLVTGNTLYINEKYQPARALENLLNFVFLSNHNDALFLDDQDRRYFVWGIVAGKPPECKVKEFVQWRDNAGLAALLHFLMQHDLSGFNPKAPAPMTDAKQQMIQDSRSDLEDWVAELMVSNVSQLIGRELATSRELARRYALATRRPEPSSRAIVNACKKLGAYARPNQVRLAAGQKLRVLALARTGHWEKQTETDWAAEMAQPFKLA